MKKMGSSSQPSPSELGGFGNQSIISAIIFLELILIPISKLWSEH
jgi:hypothetical protein